MKEVIKQYLDQGISRRRLILDLVATGMSTVAAKTMAQSLEPFAAPAKATAAENSGAMHNMTTTGAMLYVQQLKAAGVKYIFVNTGDAATYEALANERRDIQLIKGLQEGACVAMGDGYARMSGKTAIIQIASPGLPNALTQMVNTFKDHIPMLLALTAAGGEEGAQGYDFQNEMVAPITKWRWTPMSGSNVLETTRRALKFASTPPAGPVVLSISGDVLGRPATATIMDQALFDVPMQIRPDKDAVEKAARMLLAAKNPLLSVGDEVTLCRGEKEVLELAQLLGLPVSNTTTSSLGPWSKPFPTRNPLYIGPTLHDMRWRARQDRRRVGTRQARHAEDRPYLLDIHVDRTGVGAASTWYPRYSIAAQRTQKV